MLSKEGQGKGSGTEKFTVFFWWSEFYSIFFFVLMFTSANKDDIPALTPIFSIISLHSALISAQVIKTPSDWKHISATENRYMKFILPCLFWNILVLELFPRNSCNQPVYQRVTLHHSVFPECFLEDLWKNICVSMTWFVNLIWTA